MKKFNFYQLFAVILFCAFTLSVTAFAAPSNNEEVKIKVSLTTQDSKNKVELVTNVLKGVSESNYNLDDKKLTVVYNPEEINPEMILSVIDLLGFKGEVVETKPANKNPESRTSK